MLLQPSGRNVLSGRCNAVVFIFAIQCGVAGLSSTELRCQRAECVGLLLLQLWTRLSFMNTCGGEPRCIIEQKLRKLGL